MENMNLTINQNENKDNSAVKALGYIVVALCAVIVLLTLTGWLTKGYFTEGVVDQQNIQESVL